MLADYHVHTQYSDDSVYPMRDVVKDAVALGLDELCFTDHVDYGIKRDWDDPRGMRYRTDGSVVAAGVPYANVDYPRYYAEINELREEFAGQIRLKMGLEFGMQRHTIGEYEKLFAAYPFDFIILSVHQVEDRELCTQNFQRGRSQEEYNQKYYEEILALVERFHNYSILGHLDLINRYDKAGRFPFDRVRPVVAEILKTAIADGKGIEVNTSSRRYGLKDTTPSVEILKLYRELGGEIVTVGSDSHKKEHLGAYIAETYDFLRTLGFKSFCTYERMEPTFHSLEGSV